MGRRRTRHVDLGLPQRVYLENGTFFYRPKVGPKIDLGTTIASMQRRYQAITGQSLKGFEGQKLASALARKCRGRAKSYGLSCTVTTDHIVRLLQESSGVCALTGIPFDLTDPGVGRRRPWAPSVDRIDNAKGYEPENLRLVCVAVNIALSDFGEGVLMEISRRMARRYSGRNIGALTAQPGPSVRS